MSIHIYAGMGMTMATGIGEEPLLRACRFTAIGMDMDMGVGMGMGTA